MSKAQSEKFHTTRPSQQVHHGMPEVLMASGQRPAGRQLLISDAKIFKMPCWI